MATPKPLTRMDAVDRHSKSSSLGLSKAQMSNDWISPQSEQRLEERDYSQT